jgi:phosphatidylserine/phosphatidylglycerophosphate/cardiolipin synthase-like enzyme
MRRTLPVLGLLAGLLVVPAAAPQAQGAPEPRSSAAAAAARVFEPDLGATFNDPLARRPARRILRQVLKAVEATKPGEQIRLATWNFDDRSARDALIAAGARGVKVQVVVSDRSVSGSWDKLRRTLNHDGNPDSFAVRCHGGCRSRSRIMHSKLYLFSRVGSLEQVSMISSSNLTKAARYRQWNDLLTTRSPAVYDYLTRIFDEYMLDTPVAEPSEVETLGDFRIWTYPVADGANPQLQQLNRVRCQGATGRTGTPDGRTRIRIAVAGWFDTYGQAIADRLRVLWDRGCDIRIVTTLAGRGINQVLKADGRRGPVPIRELAVDRNGDGVPDRYVHQKSMAISGVFAGDTSASVVLTGSPNWSSRAARSEEVWVRLLDHENTTRQYLRHVNDLFRSPLSSSRVMTRQDLQRVLARHARSTGERQQVVDWLELD